MRSPGKTLGFQPFEAGVKVIVEDLQSRPELNGTAGTVASWDAAKGRYAVKHTASGEALLLKPVHHRKSQRQAKQAGLTGP